MFRLPGLWHDTGLAINGTELFDDDALGVLKNRCLKLQRDFLSWTEDYKSHCVRLSLTSPPSQELAMRRELFGTSCEGLIIVKRLIATVSDRDREHLETEIQALAHLLLELQEQHSPKFSWLFAGHEVGKNRPGVVDTRNDALIMTNKQVLPTQRSIQKTNGKVPSRTIQNTRED